MESRDVINTDAIDKGYSLLCTEKGPEIVERNSPSETITVLKTRKNPSSNGCNEQLLLQRLSALESKIPKYVISFDEKYLFCCLERMHAIAFKSTSTNIGIISTSLNSSGSGLDMARFAVNCPLFDVTDVIKDIVASSPFGDSVMGSITSSKSMINILKSPLLAVNSDANVLRKSHFENRDVLNPPIKIMTSTRKMLMLRDSSCDAYCKLKNQASSSSSEMSYSSIISDVVSQGFLKCTWENGIPNYMFSVDDSGEVYIANLLKIPSPKDNSIDYVYNFYSKLRGKREMKFNETELHFVGNMDVSTCVMFTSRNEKILETRFVLYGAEELQTAAHISRKNNGLKNKVVNVANITHSSNKRNPSMFFATSIEDTTREPSFEASDRFGNERIKIAENSVELAAIVVRNHVYDTPKKQDIMGWGLKFLKKSCTEQPKTSASECSTSMNILIPAGCHGGTRTRKNVPSSIVERWISDGQCDCGGWDVGCPLTVINTNPNQKQNSPPLDHAGYSKEVDLFVKGSKQSSPVMRMTIIDENLYYIHFKSTLSSLQSFSIATAIIHNKISPLTSILCRT